MENGFPRWRNAPRQWHDFPFPAKLSRHSRKSRAPPRKAGPWNSVFLRHLRECLPGLSSPLFASKMSEPLLPRHCFLVRGADGGRSRKRRGFCWTLEQHHRRRVDSREREIENDASPHVNEEDTVTTPLQTRADFVSWNY